MKQTPKLSSSESYVAHLDEKGRCSFPRELRENAVNIPVYIFYSSLHKRAIATFDENHLKEKFSDEFPCIPLQEMRISTQGTINLGWKFLRNIGIDGIQKGAEIIFMRTLGDDKFIEIHFLEETAAESINLRKSIAESVASTLLTKGRKESHFCVNMSETSSCFTLHTAQRNISASTFTVNF